MKMVDKGDKCTDSKWKTKPEKSPPPEKSGQWKPRKEKATFNPKYPKGYNG